MRVRSAAGLHRCHLLWIPDVGNVEDSYATETVLLRGREAAFPLWRFRFVLVGVRGLVAVFGLIGIFGFITVRLLLALVFVFIFVFIFVLFLIGRYRFRRKSFSA